MQATIYVEENAMFEQVETATSIETKLAKHFQKLTWIGELNIDRQDFKILSEVVRYQYSPGQLLPRTLVTSMVFSARYAEFSDDEHIRFWGKYIQDVWNRNDSQNFQSDCRERFRYSRDMLREWYGIEFPGKSQSQLDVVTDIYLHAILPAYLEDDFAEFFLKTLPNLTGWQSVLQQSIDQIAARWQTIPLPAMRKRLSRFITGSDTAPTAARLIQTLATAAVWLSEGQDEKLICQSLTPIEAAVWKQLLPRIDRVATRVPKQRERKQNFRVHWAWLFDENDILELHVKNLPLNSPIPPDRLVWLPKSEARSAEIGELVPDYGTHYCEVNAWQTEAEYTIDSATLIDIDQEGIVVAVDQTDKAVSVIHQTSSLPTDDIVFFRVQSDDRLAVLTERDALTDGMYAVIHKSNVRIVDATSKTPLVSRRQLMIPKALKALGHTLAGIYEITLPIQIGELQIEKRRVREAPFITGVAPVPGLSTSAMPVYEHGELWLTFTPPTGIPLSRLSLRLTINNDNPKVIGLSELDASGEITHETEERLRVRLNSQLPPACLVQVEVMSGFSSLSSELLILGMLPPNVSVRPSDTTQYYTVEQPPKVVITGAQEEQIALASDALVQADENEVSITWVDPRQDSAFRFQCDEVSIPLTFETRWMHAWVEPVNEKTELWEESLLEATLHVRGMPRGNFWVSVGDREPRLYQLNTRGLLDTRLADDALYDILRNYHGGEILVQLSFGQRHTPICLFKLIRPQYLEFEQKHIFIRNAIRANRDMQRLSRRGPDAATAMYLCLLPPGSMTELNHERLPSPLQEIVTATSREYEEFENVLFPQRHRQLRIGKDKSHRLDVQNGSLYLLLERPTSKGIFVVNVEVTEDVGTLYARANQLHQCQNCKDFFWFDDSVSKFRHRHGKIKLDSKSMDVFPLNGALESGLKNLAEVQGFYIDFTRFIDLSAERTYRMDASQKRAREAQATANLFSQTYYRYATAKWILRSNYDQNLERLRNSQEFVELIASRLNESEQCCFALCGKLVAALRKQRNESLNLWQRIDPTMMTLAIVARAYAYELQTLLKDELEEQMFIALLKDAYCYAPELLTWALCWSEVIFTHWGKSDL